MAKYVLQSIFMYCGIYSVIATAWRFYEILKYKETSRAAGTRSSPSPQQPSSGY